MIKEDITQEVINILEQVGFKVKFKHNNIYIKHSAKKGKRKFTKETINSLKQDKTMRKKYGNNLDILIEDDKVYVMYDKSSIMDKMKKIIGR
jgi:hypothetical protein